MPSQCLPGGAERTKAAESRLCGWRPLGLILRCVAGNYVDHVHPAVQRHTNPQASRSHRDEDRRSRFPAGGSSRAGRHTPRQGRGGRRDYPSCIGRGHVPRHRHPSSVRSGLNHGPRLDRAPGIGRQLPRPTEPRRSRWIGRLPDCRRRTAGCVPLFKRRAPYAALRPRGRRPWRMEGRRRCPALGRRARHGPVAESVCHPALSEQRRRVRGETSAHHAGRVRGTRLGRTVAERSALRYPERDSPCDAPATPRPVPSCGSPTSTRRVAPSAGSSPKCRSRCGPTRCWSGSCRFRI